MTLTPKVARIWLLSAILAAATAGIYLSLLRHEGAYSSAVHVPWIALVLGFAATEIFVAHFHFRKQTESFSLSELPLIIGLFFASPGALISAQIVGAGLALALHRRNPPLKLALNLAQFGLSTSIAILVLRAVAVTAHTLSASEAMGAYAAAIASSLVGVLAVLSAIYLTEGEGRLRAMIARLLPAGMGIAVTNTSVALIGIALLRIQPALSLLLLVPAGTLFAAYRAYTSQRRQAENIELLYHSTRAMHQPIEFDGSIRTLLEQAREMFGADIARITLLPTDADPVARRSALGPDDEYAPMAEAHLDPTSGVWARVVSEARAVCLPRPMENERLRQYFEKQDVRDAMVAPVFGGDGIVGFMLVANRLSDISTFDDRDLTLFETFVNHASVSIQNAHLVRRLQEALAHQTELNRMKDDFVATISHELRTPLTSIQGFVKTMLRDDTHYGPEEVRSYLSIVDRQSENLRLLIEDLLIVSRIAEPQTHPDSFVQLPTLADHVVQGFMHGEHRLQMEFDENLPPIRTDDSGVRRILSNLIHNAVKYTPEGTPIRVTGSVSGSGVLLSVEDEGPGVPEGQDEKIFERFYQVDQSTTRRVGGAGLGLYISRSLAESLGGKLWLEPSDSGARFHLWLPLNRGTRADMDIPPRSQRARAAAGRLGRLSGL